MNYLLLSSLSFVMGLIVGLTGVGGAALITPMLILVFQVPASVAISSDIVAATLMKGGGSMRHWHQQTLDLDIVKWLAIGSVPGSLTGIGLLHSVQQNYQVNLDAISIVTQSSLNNDVIQSFQWSGKHVVNDAAT
jgi:uncharacterized membrane protein YfcA